MLRIGIVEDEIDDLVAVIRNLMTLNQNDYPFELFPVLLSNSEDDDDIAYALEEKGLSQLRNDGFDVSHPPTINNKLGALNPAHPPSREKILNYFADKQIHVLISDSWLGKDSEDKSEELDVRQESSGWKLLDVALTKSPWYEQKWKCWLMTKYQSEVVADFAKEGGWQPENFNPLRLYDWRIIDKNEATKRIPSKGCMPILKKAVEEGIEHAKLMENTKLPDEVKLHGRFGSLIGKSEAMQEVYRQILLFAEHNTSILINGEPGTGKELIAKAIHEKSRRRGSFIAQNCGALAESLLESELFGHAKGAFTGATAEKKGLFRSADGGTLFLDEIGETTPALQIKLLRALQEHEVTPVGSSSPIKFDARIIAATNKKLETEVAEKNFREDLLTRLSGLEIHLPPLRERREDIPLLCEHFLLKYQYGNPTVKGFSTEAMRIIQNDSWQGGNARNLEHFVERAIIFAEGQTIINEQNEAVQQLLSSQQKTKTAPISIPQPSVNMIPAPSNSSNYVNMPADEILEKILNGTAPKKGLAQWKKEIGEPKTLELARVVENHFGGHLPPENFCQEFFRQSQGTYRGWVFQARQRQNQA